MKHAIILVQPQMGENIGAAARVMLNFGLTDLRIVNPRDGWPNEKAFEMSAGAKKIITNAKIFESTEKAVSDLEYVYATTARNRDLDKKITTPQDIQPRKNSGILFGPERSGLENEDLKFANELISIPVNHEYSSLNLAMSVGIIAYEISTQKPSKLPERELATKEEFSHMLSHLEELLDRKSFFQTPEKKPGMVQNIAAMLTRAEFSPQEIRTLRGILRSLSSAPSKS